MSTPSETWSYGLFIPHDPRAVGVVRAALRHILAGAKLNCLADTAELMVSELVTNAYRYTKTDAYVSVDRSPHDLTIAVWDTGTGTPEQQKAAPDDETGRGLGIVDACADSWGVRDYPNGKSVWFTLAPQA
ncbi:ATP-binding protein [Streptomyces natalensis]|uniref:Regulatory protein n=1 Tax=Streptomyces natalensis ATCC 27448 TaxID=1240678 RepID=A0A0D7CFW4_9ACTN|nr:ATP-binding protein [Streptomyces natalensis]KIZ14287.1 regulatory protein [Streptomyces natalensis ATCC 27448]